MAANGEDRARLVEWLRSQSRSAAQLGSPLYALLLEGAAEDVATGGPCWPVLQPWAHEGEGMAVPLRFMGAVHRVVLRHQAPALGLHYASVGGGAGLDGALEAFRDTVEAHTDLLTELTGLACQTNEVGRSAALGPGLAWLAGRHPAPLHHLEIGASAGLNLRWDRFAYGTADRRATWGPPDSPVDLVGHWLDAPVALADSVEIATRRGCDPAPLDPGSQLDRETLTASIWADMPLRHQRLKGALALAGEIPAEVSQAHAGEWLAEQLPAREEGLTVVTHSVVWRYIDPAEQAEIVATLERVGEQASASRPLVWLRLEPRPPMMRYDGTPYPLLATCWPGGQTLELATAQAHGQDVRWVVGTGR